jgi:hypothetical protein
MGLTWSAPQVVLQGKKLLLSAPFVPESKDAIWELWRAKKDALKTDGFSVSKDKTSGEWKIMYWHDITDDSRKMHSSGIPNWQVVFNAKYAKWVDELEKIKTTVVVTEEYDF